MGSGGLGGKAATRKKKREEMADELISVILVVQDEGRVRLYSDHQVLCEREERCLSLSAVTVMGDYEQARAPD